MDRIRFDLCFLEKQSRQAIKDRLLNFKIPVPAETTIREHIQDSKTKNELNYLRFKLRWKEEKSMHKIEKTKEIEIKKIGGIYFFRIFNIGGSLYKKKNYYNIDTSLESFDRAVLKTTAFLVGIILIASIIAG
jgi:hypothetical protein